MQSKCTLIYGIGLHSNTVPVNLGHYVTFQLDGKNHFSHCTFDSFVFVAMLMAVFLC